MLKYSYFSRLFIVSMGLFITYYVLVRPVRLKFNEKLLYPFILSVLNKEDEVFIDQENPFVTMINKERSNKPLKIKTPFGKWWLIPFSFLFSLKEKYLINKLTIYHTMLTFIIPVTLIIALPGFFVLFYLLRGLILMNVFNALLFIIFGIRAYKNSII